MQINLEEMGGISVFRVSGDIDINSSPDVKKSFDKAINAKKNKVVINLKDVGYVDSSGLATLVEIFKNLRSLGGKLKLTNLSGKVKGLFEITKLDKLFDILPEEKDAIASF
ncbi:MAG: STAS domain-containing protein [Candidatus Omnitrophica bacterium]|jgi:anti-sigma B factor antagonist|nr:STAS domain-containing protein [Candidatus Omnitrophota bacterium]